MRESDVGNVLCNNKGSILRRFAGVDILPCSPELDICWKILFKGFWAFRGSFSIDIKALFIGVSVANYISGAIRVSYSTVRRGVGAVT